MHIRNVTSAIFGLALLIGATGCGSESHPKDAGDWSYNPPADFTQQDKQKNGATVFLGPQDSGFTANLMVQAIGDQNKDAKTLGQEVLTKATAQSGVTVKEQEPYSLGDSDAYTWLISRTGKNGLIAQQRQFIVKKNHVAVRFTLSASEKSMPKWDQALADSFQSFKWGRQ